MRAGGWPTGRRIATLMGLPNTAASRAGRRNDNPFNALIRELQDARRYGRIRIDEGLIWRIASRFPRAAEAQLRLFSFRSWRTPCRPPGHAVSLD